MEILISNRQNISINLELIKNLSLFVLKEEKANIKTEISFSLVKPLEMRQLNKQYSNKDEATDILSFVFNEDKKPFNNLLGDIVLCPEEIQVRALKNQLTFDKYFQLLIVHGVLHLLGYGHESDSGAKVMSDTEEELLKKYQL